MKNIPSLTKTRRPTVNKRRLAEAMPCDKWFNSETLVIVFSNGVETTLAQSIFGNKIRDLCGDLVEEKTIARRVHFRISTLNKEILISKAFNSENKIAPRAQKITPHRLSEEDKLLNLALSA